MDNRYQPLKIEAKWQRSWRDEKIYEVDLKTSHQLKGKFYAFGMFNYPSGEGIHVGHVKNFTIPDVLLRLKRQQGYLVYAPVGFDSFGLPADNFAAKTGIAPRLTTDRAIANYSQQYQMCGFSFDWSKIIDTSQALYYRWTQWCFLQLFKAGLAYRKASKQWWCASCQTVLADEQVINGKCWRHEAADDPLIGRKSLEQWYFKITDYADKILEATPDLNWTEWVKVAQQNYIGRSLGVEISFKLEGLTLSQTTLKVFTTALETIYGATFAILSPEHPLVKEIINQAENQDQLKQYLRQAQAKTEVARQQAKQKTGVQIKDLYIINPITLQKMSVWLADYVLASYGTGAIMAVPANDSRDLEFAKAYNLPIVYTTTNQQFVDYKDIAQNPQKYTLVSDDSLNGLDMAAAKEAIFKKLKAAKLVARRVNFKLRDWLISRQRYWGAPIPIIFCESCGILPVDEDDLPVELPDIKDYQPAGDGRSPLAKAEQWLKVKCPQCQNWAQRETDTMDGYVCSSWYQMRYLSATDQNQAWDVDLAKKWLPVDFYNGADHATAHLIYARFFTRFFYEQSLLAEPEPFKQMYLHAKISAPDGQAFSKSRGNGINPLDIINEGYGADALRLYICSVAPPDVEVIWSSSGVPAAYRFLNRVWQLNVNYLKASQAADLTKDQSLAILRATHQCIDKNDRDLVKLKFNTALAAQMELVNSLYKIAVLDKFQSSAWQFALESLTMLLAPFAPHLASELWQRLGHSDHVHLAHWPQLDRRYLATKEIEIAIQVNGKLRGSLLVASHSSKSQVVELAQKVDSVARHLKGQTVQKTIYVKHKIVNFVY